MLTISLFSTLLSYTALRISDDNDDDVDVDDDDEEIEKKEIVIFHPSVERTHSTDCPTLEWQVSF
jgi:hypothetical protein